VGYWKWFKDKYMPKKADVKDFLAISGYLASLVLSFFIPFFVFGLSNWDGVSTGVLSIVCFLVYAFFSYSYISYMAEKQKKVAGD
jgi:hypothetical protein